MLDFVAPLIDDPEPDPLAQPVVLVVIHIPLFAVVFVGGYR